MSQFCRTQALIGQQNQQLLAQKHVAVFGLGGVGGYTAEALARAGVGSLTLVDFDLLDATNINRQILALHSTVGLRKTDVAAARIADINPQANVHAVFCRFDEATAGNFDFSQFDYVVDAIDSVPCKVLLAVQCQKAGTPIISCMGTGNKMDATAFRVADISQTSVCPLAKAMRKALKAQGVTSLKTVFSPEQPAALQTELHGGGKPMVGSVSFVPSVAGLILAGEVVKDLLNLGK